MDALKGSVLVVSESPDNCGRAFDLARRLREEGTTVELDVARHSLNDALAYAATRQFRQVVFVDSQGEQAAYDVE